MGSRCQVPTGDLALTSILLNCLEFMLKSARAAQGLSPGSCIPPQSFNTRAAFVVLVYEKDISKERCRV